MAQCYAKIINPDAGYADWPQGTFRYWLYTDSLSQSQAEAQFRGYSFPQMITLTTTSVPTAPAGTTWSVRSGGTTPPIPITGLPGDELDYKRTDFLTVTMEVLMPSSNPDFLEMEAYDFDAVSCKFRNKKASSDDGEGHENWNLNWVNFSDLRFDLWAIHDFRRFRTFGGTRNEPDDWYNDPVKNALERIGFTFTYPN